MYVDCRWLLIFDNADDLELIMHVWPGDVNGSVLITSRDFNAAHSPAGAGFHVQPLDDEIGSELLLHFVGLDSKAFLNHERAIAINRALGGLPLALNQMGSFISQRKVSLEDFLPLYERNSAKIDARKSRLTHYEHTLSTVWEMSLSKLAGPPAHLQKLLAFLEPDAIDEQVLSQGSLLINDDEELAFLNDEME